MAAPPPPASGGRGLSGGGGMREIFTSRRIVKGVLTHEKFPCDSPCNLLFGKLLVVVRPKLPVTTRDKYLYTINLIILFRISPHYCLFPPIFLNPTEKAPRLFLGTKLKASPHSALYRSPHQNFSTLSKLSGEACGSQAPKAIPDNSCSPSRY